MKCSTLITTAAALILSASVLQAQPLRSGESCYELGEQDGALQDLQNRGNSRLASLCGDSDSCRNELGSVALLSSLPWETTWLGAELCYANSQADQLAEQNMARDFAGNTIDLTICEASSEAVCGEERAACSIDLVSGAPFNPPREEPIVQCEHLGIAIESIGAPLQELMQPHNPQITGDTNVSEGDLNHDTSSPLSVELGAMSQTLMMADYFGEIGEQAEQAMFDVSSMREALVLAAVEMTPEDIVDELGLDPTLIQPWVSAPAGTLPTHPTDSDCERIRQAVAAKRVAVDCSQLEAAYLAALLDLADAQADLSDANDAFDAADAAFTAADTAARDAKADMQTAADAITDLVNRHIHHSGISTDGAGGAHRNMIGLSSAGVGFSIYFDGSQSSINTILWLFNTDAYRDAKKAFSDAAKAYKAAEAAKSQAGADWMNAFLDVLDASDAVDAAQARADAAQQALDACRARQRDAQQDLSDCEDKLNECVGRQQTDTDSAQGGARSAINGATSEADTADGFGTDTTGGRSAIQGAQDKLDESEQAESDGRHDDAQRLAREAQAEAEAERTRLAGQNAENQECSDEADRRQRAARRAIDTADTELDEAEERGDNTTADRSRLSGAEQKLRDSERAQSENRFEDAKRLADEATAAANAVTTSWEAENNFWDTHSPCDPEGATYDELVSEYCSWNDSEPHLVPLGHTPTSYRALGAVRKLISAVGYAFTGSDPVNDAVDNIMALSSINGVRELYAFYNGTYTREYETFVCVDDGSHQYWVSRGTHTETGALDECGYRLTDGLDEILDISTQGSEEATATAVREYLARCQPTGCSCERPASCD